MTKMKKIAVASIVIVISFTNLTSSVANASEVTGTLFSDNIIQGPGSLETGTLGGNVDSGSTTSGTLTGATNGGGGGDNGSGNGDNSAVFGTVLVASTGGGGSNSNGGNISGANVFPTGNGIVLGALTDGTRDEYRYVYAEIYRGENNYGEILAVETTSLYDNTDPITKTTVTTGSEVKTNDTNNSSFFWVKVILSIMFILLTLLLLYALTKDRRRTRSN